MLKNRIIPCLDVKNGRVVKGINFVDLKDAGDPVEQAKIYSDGGADEICFLDITASNENRETIIDIVRKTAKECFVPLTVGGGVRTIQNITELLHGLNIGRCSTIASRFVRSGSSVHPLTIGHLPDLIPERLAWKPSSDFRDTITFACFMH